jgi:hypothetical protein
MPERAILFGHTEIVVPKPSPACVLSTVPVSGSPKMEKAKSLALTPNHRRPRSVGDGEANHGFAAFFAFPSALVLREQVPS